MISQHDCWLSGREIGNDLQQTCTNMVVTDRQKKKVLAYGT